MIYIIYLFFILICICIGVIIINILIYRYMILKYCSFFKYFLCYLYRVSDGMEKVELVYIVEL